MATVLTEDAMLAALKKWGITPKFQRPDWRTHDRDKQQGWGPLYGFVVHNFGSDISDANSANYLYNGDLARNMPGPLSQFAITDDGAVWIIGWGTANHTGSIDPRLLDLVKKDAAPRSNDWKPNTSFSNNTGTHNVNAHFVGVEMTYGKAPTDAQRKSVVRLAAAIMDALGEGYTGGSVVGHRETDMGRSDPVGIPMWSLRREVDALLKAGPTGTAPATPAPAAPAPTERLFMSLTPAQEQTILKASERILERVRARDVTNAKGVASQAAVLDGADGNYMVGYLDRIEKLAKATAAKAGVDIDEAELAAGLVDSLKPIVAEAVAAAVTAGVPTDQLAEAVVARLGTKLSG